MHDELKHIVGESGILPEAQIADYTFDGHVPKVVVLPASVQEIQDVLGFASRNDLSVIPAGSGTKLGIGNLPEKVDVLLATTRLNSVVEYEPADLTVTVEAGIRLTALQAELAKHRQFCHWIHRSQTGVPSVASFRQMRVDPCVYGTELPEIRS